MDRAAKPVLLFLRFQYYDMTYKRNCPYIRVSIAVGVKVSYEEVQSRTYRRSTLKKCPIHVRSSETMRDHFQSRCLSWNLAMKSSIRKNIELLISNFFNSSCELRSTRSSWKLGETVFLSGIYVKQNQVNYDLTWEYIRTVEIWT